MIISGIVVCYMRIHVLTSDILYALCINVLFVVPICCGVCTFVLLVSLMVCLCRYIYVSHTFWNLCKVKHT